MERMIRMVLGDAAAHVDWKSSIVHGFIVVVSRQCINMESFDEFDEYLKIAFRDALEMA